MALWIAQQVYITRHKILQLRFSESCLQLVRQKKIRYIYIKQV